MAAKVGAGDTPTRKTRHSARSAPEVSGCQRPTGTASARRTEPTRSAAWKRNTSNRPGPALPVWLVEFPNTPLFTVAGVEFRAAFVTAVAIVLAVHVILTRFRPARRLFAVGSNPEAAEMAGIDLKKTVFVAFVAAGALAGLAGFMFLARFGNITVVAGLGFELKSVAAAVVGGVAIFGGSGSVIGALIGAILVDLIDTSLVRWELVSEFWREAVLGILILAAVTVDQILGRRLLALRIRREKGKREGGA